MVVRTLLLIPIVGQAQVSTEFMDKLAAELKALAASENIKLVDNEIDDVLIYALFPQVGTKFLQNRGNADAFEPAPGAEEVPVTATSAPEQTPAAAPGEVESYRVSVNGTEYDVVVGPGNADISQVTPVAAPAAAMAIFAEQRFIIHSSSW